MARKRRKHPALPNGFGSIKYLGPNRRNPYAVHPPTTEFRENGSPITPKAIAYVDDWYYGFAILLAYKAGTYIPGIYPSRPQITAQPSDLDALTRSILTDYSKSVGRPVKNAPTFAEVYDMFFAYKFRENQKKKLSKSTENSTRAAFKNCAPLHDKIFEELRHDDLQSVVDNCPLKHASLELIVSLFHQMYAYADIRDICKTDHSRHVRINREDDDENGIPFTEEELKILWDHKTDSIVQTMLIMCYSGYRILAYTNMEVNIEEKYFQGGVKTKAGKNRIVPIHSAIYPFVKDRIEKDGCLLSCTPQDFRLKMYAKLAELGIEKHTPHDCRHTFSALCEKYGVNENDRKRMLGHSFGNDITNSIYGHRSVEDLRKEIEKIICY